MTQLHLGYHFCGLRNGHPVLRDGTPLEIGRTYEHAGPLRMCESGYHDSERVIYALRYAPGPYLCRTLSSCDLADTDKRVSRTRVALAGYDATRDLHLFAVRIAYCALLAERERGREPDPRSWEALRVKLRWLDGQATDADLSAARLTAWAAWGRAWTAARLAAWETASATLTAQSAAEAMLLSMLPAELTEENEVSEKLGEGQAMLERLHRLRCWLFHDVTTFPDGSHCWRAVCSCGRAWNYAD